MSSTEAAVEAPEQVLVFSLGADRFCVGIDHVDEIVKAGATSSIPEAPRIVEGVMDLRGETTTVIDPATVFGSESTETDQQVIVFDTGDGKIGWLVDRVSQVDTLRDPETEAVDDNPYVEGILTDGDAFTLWVDPDRVHGEIE